MNPKQLLIWLLCLLTPWTAVAQNPFDQFFSDSPFLPVDEAFIVSAEQRGDKIRVHWSIAKEYYLYRHQLEFSVAAVAASAADQPVAIALGPANIPAGEPKHDEYFGDVEIYYDELVVELPLKNSSVANPNTPLEVEVSATYQGCAEAGLCYPPTTKLLPILLKPINGTSSAQPNTLTSDNNQADSLQAQLNDGFSWQLLATFFGLGVLLAFTPCVLPMIPILSGIVVGAKSGMGRGFSLSLAYVLAMSAAYALLGAAAGFAGANLQIVMQHPIVISLFAALFVALALAMFGLYELQIPAGLQSKLTKLSNQQKGGSLAGAAIMGLLSALIVGPCLTPPLAASLLYISQSGDAWLGSQALFALGLGMGLPLLIAGTLGASLLPKAGLWMKQIQGFFGFVLLGVAIWLASRIVPAQWIMFSWSTLVLGFGLTLVNLGSSSDGPIKIICQLVGVFSLIYGAALALGGLSGNTDPSKPLAGIIASQGATQEHSLDFRPIKSLDDLQTAVASNNNRISMLDFYADWCVSCIEMENELFPAANVAEKLAQMNLLRADVTANDKIDQALMEKFSVVGPPTLLFFDQQGNELVAFRLIGEISQAAFSAHLDKLLNRSSPQPLTR